MKILNVEQIRSTDAFTIKNEPIESSDLMERAANAFALWFVKNFAKPAKIAIFCGIGNNGGDGLALARLLSLRHFEVSVYIVRFSEKCSADFAINERRLQRFKEISVKNMYSAKDFPTFLPKTIIIDALFGSGLSRKISGFTAQIIEKINETNNTILAIDTPSGLYADKHSETDSAIIEATHTVSFEMPKLAFMLPQNYKYVGEWHTVSIGLNADFIEKQATNFYFLTEKIIKKIERKSQKFAHKGTNGHTLVIGGSYGKIGAVVLTALASLKTGAGLVTAFVPKCGYTILQTSAKEVMCLTAENEKYIAEMPFHDFKKYKNYRAIAIGIGLGMAAKTQDFLLSFLEKIKMPLVLDADALNIIAKNNWLEKVPKNSILTPHPKEFERLAGKTDNEFERLELLRSLSKKHELIIILKGSHTAISLPNGQCFFNSTGNSAMATAGSGDVLTGVIAAFVSQGYTMTEAALLGVFHHGLAGDRAAVGKMAISAGDMLAFLREI
ncbi:MAG: NAD(P)H-hydrate dehydratase [Chitinophagales bacterium]